VSRLGSEKLENIGFWCAKCDSDETRGAGLLTAEDAEGHRGRTGGKRLAASRQCLRVNCAAMLGGVFLVLGLNCQRTISRWAGPDRIYVPIVY